MGLAKMGSSVSAVLPCREPRLIMPDAGKAVANAPSAPPQIPHKFGFSGVIPTRYPQTIRHSPAHGGTAARMGLLALASKDAGRTGWRGSRSRMTQGATDPLLSGRSRVRVAVGALRLSDLGERGSGAYRAASKPFRLRPLRTLPDRHPPSRTWWCCAEPRTAAAQILTTMPARAG